MTCLANFFQSQEWNSLFLVKGFQKCSLCFFREKLPTFRLCVRLAHSRKAEMFLKTANYSDNTFHSNWEKANKSANLNILKFHFIENKISEWYHQTWTLYTKMLEMSLFWFSFQRFRKKRLKHLKYLRMRKNEKVRQTEKKWDRVFYSMLGLSVGNWCLQSGDLSLTFTWTQNETSLSLPLFLTHSLSFCFILTLKTKEKYFDNLKP